MQTELSSRLRELITARRAADSGDRPPDVLGMIVNARDQDGGALSDEQVLAHVNILLVAGHETTTMLGAWVLYLLATHPAYLERVRRELDQALATPGETFSLDTMRNTPFLGNVVKEAARLESPVALLPRGIIENVEFAGFELPGGTPVRLAIAATHRLPGIFAEPARFDPDRFLPPREEDKRAPYALATFGGGTRICIGINFAQIEVKALVAQVVQRFDLVPISPTRPEQRSGITAFVPEGIHVRAIKR